MTRQARTLIVLGLFGLFGVVALGVMARRYGTLLEARVASGAASGAASGGSAARTADEAERRVRAFVVVRELVADEVGRSHDRPVPERQERLERVLAHALDAERLDREEYERIASMLRTWERAGTPPAAPYLSPLSRRRAYLDSLPTGPLEAPGP